jgi:hypothetical protein
MFMAAYPFAEIRHRSHTRAKPCRGAKQGHFLSRQARKSPGTLATRQEKKRNCPVVRGILTLDRR